MSFRSFRHLLSRVATAAAVTVSAGASADPTPGDAARAAPASDVDRDDELAGQVEGHALAFALADLAPLDATHTACTLALSPRRDQRLALAHALEWAFRLVGDDLVIDHLASDGDPAIRRAAARAAWARRAIGGDPGVLARLADDPDSTVREVVALAGPHR